MARKLKCAWPPYGRQVRKLIAAATLAVGIPRLPFFGIQSYNPLRFADPWVYGIVMTLLGILLLTTACKITYHSMRKKVIAGFGFVCWSMLAAATTSTTSFWINVAFSISLLMEVWMNDYD